MQKCTMLEWVLIYTKIFFPSIDSCAFASDINFVDRLWSLPMRKPLSVVNPSEKVGVIARDFTYLFLDFASR